MQKYINAVADKNGKPVSGASVLVQNYPGGTSASIYSDNNGTTQTNPISTDPNGGFSFYAADGRYTLQISGSGIVTQTINDVLLEDPTDGGSPGSFTTLTVSGTATIGGANALTSSNVGAPGTAAIIGSSAGTVQTDIDARPTSSTLAASGGAASVGTIQSGTGTVQRTVAAKLNDVYSVKDTGAVSDGTTNDATAVAQAIANSPQAGKLMIPADTYIGTSRVSNADGVRFVGQGLVKYTPSATLGNRVQQPAGRDSASWGAEYLYQFLVKLRAFSTTKIRISGDSTAANLGTALAYLVQNIPTCTLTTVTNSGKSTADWISTYLAADVAAANDVLIWHWGMNDACAGVGTPTTMAQFESNLRSGLTTYRASVPIGTGGIILMTPNASSDGTNGRDEYRNEKMRQIIRNAAEDFQCAYFDTYSVYQDGYVGIGSWLDNTYSDGLRGIHPQSAFAAAIAGGVYNLLIPSGIQQVIGGINNANSLSSGRLPADAISVYSFGVSVWRAQSANSWPIDGWVYTFRENHNASSCFQILYCYNSDVAPLMRTGISSGAWGNWRRLGVNRNIDGTSTTAGSVASGIGYTWFDANTASSAFNLTLPAPIDGDKLTIVFNNATGTMTFTPTAPATNVTRLPTTAIPAKVPFSMIYNAANTSWYPA